MARLLLLVALLATTCQFTRHKCRTWSQSIPEPGSSHPIRQSRRLFGSSFASPGNKSYDYIVVGAGNAGLPLAVRLAEGGYQVAVIEAGSFSEIGNSNYTQIPALAVAFTGNDMGVLPQVDWNFRVIPQKAFGDRALLYPRGKAIGGSSTRNFNCYQRGTKGSYKLWADKVGDDSYTWDKVLPFFEKSITFTPPPDTRFRNATPMYDRSTLGNRSGPLHLTFPAYAWPFSTWGKKALAAVGIHERKGFTSGKLIGSSHQLFTIHPTEQTRDSAETSFLRRVGLNNPNLIVYPNTMATRILFDDDKRATGILVDVGGYTYNLNASKEVIISAGAIQSPQLLMVSGVGPEATLKRCNISVIADRPGVGQNMTDHVLGGPSYRIALPSTDDFAKADFIAVATEQYNTYPSTGPYASHGGDLLAFEKFPKEYLSTLSKYTIDSLKTLPADWPHVEYMVISAYGHFTEDILGIGPHGYNFGTIQVALAAPFSRGSVSIHSGNIYDHPIIDPRWLEDRRDQEIAIAGYKRLREIFNTQELNPILVGEEYMPGINITSDKDLLKMIQSSFYVVHHASCTCRMGRRNDPNAVVDSKARVFGVKRLRVVDASIFPILPPGHPMATVYMIAEKIADDILKGK
ncbi:hypothetical protein FQN57_001305 [Myotisia sp. PD_48]|nr:hypothetical protein FQN57_001305 [Myotisia sp. PD_48]